ncbi:hypothetical protein A2631_02885 [Candidatus Daviesbacteria bacterium RIFCSPHIGHO2_01_FULL_44_29]|uniref:Glycosyltransferase RgtA/B/C/D-like domain-containing protein n=1 Tax=Candidatus Daviesbacteria bacterium RIFCSPHIGHO2_02_FULL_43_12 TaxID=1797776 RepID=A0A1F5KKH0_9BACT|nr:MAG: hypothetical protein A2631_02885 [Candidatus Daviesbacteria bacterium RIFCSPHIGHO2_01_FULL_44_29]OGE40818.1 MAG: hypothetical protein A3E86_02465 [Candidatus Daviesbacteria bacterium RIFCSPHIGHO2_12_FULL_47_45]OGE41329.1 MAG: hypothetical protein A3D25_02280 [Candidatus Daviesbacteria bacterium RIFCSPHIGHO2_02_FULL_43_12]OGE69530.1 MAG: hypothetical protein A3B55_04020 [Candidatus Daviesbacteria bacterium RIFCSPLOWO2_01_FULL_43_15]
MTILLSLLFPILGFILQTYTRLFNKSFGVDVWTRLLETDHVRENNHKIPGKIAGQFIIEGYFDYPPVFPWLLSFFPKKLVERYQGVVAPFFDLLNNTLIFWIAFYFTQSIEVALFSQLIYTLTPVIALENSSLTPRSLGYLNFNLAFMSSLLWVYTGNIWFLTSSVVFTTLIFLSHRFAMQSLLFLSIFFSIYQKNPFYIGVFILGFVLATVTTKGYYLKVLKGHLYNIYFWIPNRMYRFAHQIRGLQNSNKKKDFVELVYTLLSKFAPITLIGTNFWVISAFVILFVNIFYLSFLPLSPIRFINDFSAWVLFFYFLGIPILMLTYLRCIGEGYRYLEMAALPTSIISSWIFFQLLVTPLGSLAVIGYGVMLALNLGLILSVHRTIIKDRNRSITSDMTNVFDFLNNQKEDYRILCIPHQNTTNVIYHTKHKVFVNADNPGLLPISVVYPIIKWPLTDTIEKYQLNLILLKESFAKIEELKLKSCREIFRSGDIVLLAVKGL